MSLEFWRGKSVLVTGHTGFKGAWLCEILRVLGSNVIGYALPHPKGGVYDSLGYKDEITSVISDIRDFDSLKSVIEVGKPEIIFHLAAQPLVLDAFKEPAYTFETNVQGTVNLLDSVRLSECVKSIVIVTTDKVYKNNEWVYGYRENDILGDTEPYAASKACTEIVAECYSQTFLRTKNIALSTTRAGNVIGGGDVSSNRIIPDCIRAAVKGESILIRNKYSVRPYQHVIEPLFAYLLIAEKQYNDISYSGQYNIGPSESDCVTTSHIADLFCKSWGGVNWIDKSNPSAPHESNILKLDCSKMRTVFGWKPLWDISTSVLKTVEWEKSVDKKVITENQIKEYLNLWKS